ncbi:MAG TPA: PQQ-binding-like beta-propeller repeat protein [Thermomicrobiales bacterium]
MSVSIKTCPVCGQASPATFSFCPNCGQSIVSATPVILSGSVARDLPAFPAYMRRQIRRRRPADGASGGGFVWLGFVLILIPILLSRATPLSIATWVVGIVMVIAGFWRLRIDPLGFSRAGLTTNVIAALALAGVIVQVARTSGEEDARPLLTRTATPTATTTPDWLTAAGSTPPANAAKHFGTVPMFRGGPTHTGLQPGPGPSGTPYRKWRFDTGGEVRSSPAVAEGLVFVGSQSGLLHAIEVETGRPRWSFDLGGYPVRSSPAVVDGTVYIGSGYALYALDAKTGEVRWRFGMRYAGESSPTVADGVVYVASKEALVYAIDATTGDEKWHFQTEGLIFSSPTIAAGLVLIGSDDGQLYAVDIASGHAKWKFAADGEVYSSPAVAGDRVFVVSKSHATYAVDLHSGKPIWHFPVGGDASPTVVGDTVFVGGEDGGIYALDAATGELRWLFPTGRPIHASPAAAEGILYVPSGLTIFAIDAANGQELWKYPVSDTIGVSPAVVDGILYCADGSGYVYAIAGDAPADAATPAAE